MDAFDVIDSIIMFDLAKEIMNDLVNDWLMDQALHLYQTKLISSHREARRQPNTTKNHSWGTGAAKAHL